MRKPLTRTQALTILGGFLPATAVAKARCDHAATRADNDPATLLLPITAPTSWRATVIRIATTGGYAQCPELFFKGGSFSHKDVSVADDSTSISPEINGSKQLKEGQPRATILACKPPP